MGFNAGDESDPVSTMHTMLTIFIDCEGRPDDAVEATLRSLRIQSSPSFETILIGRNPDKHSRNPLLSMGCAITDGQHFFRLDSADTSRGDYAMFLTAGDTLVKQSLERVGHEADRYNPDLIILDYLFADGGRQFLPGWDPNLLESLDYVQRAYFIARRWLVGRSVVDFRRGLFSFIGSGTQQPSRVHHVAEPLVQLCGPRPQSHWKADVAEDLPSLSVIIPNRNGLSLLPRCVAFLRALSPAPQLIIVDNLSDDPGIAQFYDGLRKEFSAQILRYDRSFNYAGMINQGVAAADGEFILLLNNDVFIEEPTSVSAALSYAMRSDVGVVGSLLRYPDGRVQHAGMALRYLDNGVDAEHVLRFQRDDEGSFPGALTAPKNWQSVTGAFHLIRRSVFAKAGGYDEVNLPVEHNDVDFCLRVRALGLNVICLPLPGIVHCESYTRGTARTVKSERLNRQARAVMAARWQKEFANDPFLNPGIDAGSRRPGVLEAISRFGEVTWKHMRSALALRLKAKPIKEYAQAAMLARHLKPGLSIVGPFASSTEAGQVSRAVARACDAARLPLSLVDSSREQSVNGLDSLRHMFVPRDDRQVALCIGDLDKLAGQIEMVGEGRFRIAWPCLGDTKVTQESLSGLSAFEEVWLTSDVLRDRLVAAGRTNVRVLPATPESSPDALGLAIGCELGRLNSGDSC